MKTKRMFQAICGPLALSLSVAAPCSGQALPTVPTAKVVALAPGVCSMVTEGDILEFEWNPALQGALTETQLSRFTMRFARIGEERVAARTGGGLLLQAVVQRGDAGPLGPQIVAQPNGFYKISLPVALHGAPSGDYRLIDADAEAWNSPVHETASLVMTNSPIRSPFCLTVDAALLHGKEATQ
jgi:hypothetical protein